MYLGEGRREKRKRRGKGDYRGIGDVLVLSEDRWGHLRSIGIVIYTIRILKNTIGIPLGLWGFDYQ